MKTQMKTRTCNQLKCFHNQFGGCQTCEECGAMANEVSNNCVRCWNCENDEGILRWDSKYAEMTLEEFAKLVQKMKEAQDKRKTEIIVEQKQKKKEIPNYIG